MPIDLTRFDSSDARHCGGSLLEAMSGAPSSERAAKAACRLLYEALTDDAGQRTSALVRCYRTQPYGALPPDLQRFAKRAFGRVAISPPDPAMRCLTLLATVGDEPAWNDRRRSEAHQAIPLPSPHIVERAPMVARLIRELGFELTDVIRPSTGLIQGGTDDAVGVFHVEEAAGSPYIPAQDFVRRYAIRSVLGFGGALPTRELFAFVLFTRTHVPADLIEFFRPIAADVGSAFAALSGAPVFDGTSASPA